jgi:hypothetical protein
MLLRTQTLPRLMFNITAVVLALVLLQSALNAAVTTVQTLLTLNVEIGTVADEAEVQVLSLVAQRSHRRRKPHVAGI